MTKISATKLPPPTDIVSRRRHASDLVAFRYIGKFEMRRVPHGDFGLFVRGTTVRVGTVYAGANQFARALSNTLESSAYPAQDRMLRAKRDSDTGLIVGKR